MQNRANGLLGKLLASLLHRQPNPFWPPIQAEGGVALITMVRNEDTLLRFWLRHYMRLLDAPKFIVIDDASDRVDTRAVIRDAGAEARCDVIALPPGPFSARYKAASFSALANMMLARAAIVIASDVDEVVAPLGNARHQPFEATLRAAPRPFASPIGLQILHDGATEPPFDPDRPIGKQRQWGELHGPSTKPMIWQGHRAEFIAGQHRLWNAKSPVIADLATLHLRWVDHDTVLRRQAERNQAEYGALRDPVGGGHWGAAPESLRQSRYMNPTRYCTGAGRVTDVAPEFIHAHMSKRGPHHVLKKRQISAPVTLTDCL